ncbi:MAG: hypothetical protein US45_C0024G0003 [Candidatus Nomurabacteria bacterium GW2011_GWA1_37_20]|uniref:NYN domain-containing protein n=2 Tax=Parcubacteria group TaxID=1794811 RepID=A0A0G0I688_9BACT
MHKEKGKKEIILRGKTAVFIDWANVYGWKKSLKSEVDISILYKYLKSYKNIGEIYLYFGKDNHPKSEEFLNRAEKIGYKIITKPVKYILIENFETKKIYRRKCDFDMEVCIDVHKKVAENFESFVFFTGDGDFEPLYKLLVELKKQTIVVYTKGHLGREIWNMKNGIFKVELENLIDI